MTRQHWRSSFFWLLVFSFLWWILSGGNGWGFAVPSIVLAAVMAMHVEARPFYINLLRLPAFFVFFVTAMFAGAWDVARRALQPRLTLNPEWVTYQLSSQNPRARLMCSTLVGLLPGTLASHVDGDTMHVHVLDSAQDWRVTLEQLEKRLHQLFTQEDKA